VDPEDDISGDIQTALTAAAETPEPVAPEAPAEPAAPVASEPAPPAKDHRPPAAWSAQAKADFAQLPAHIRAEVLKRERDMDLGLAERAAELKRYEPLEQAIAPHRQRLAMSGLSEDQYLRALIAADEALRGPNPLQAIAAIARQYGVDLTRQQAPQQPGSPAHPSPSATGALGQLAPPQLSGLIQEVAALKASLAQQSSAYRAESQSRKDAELAAFAADHLYFENVRADMARLIDSGLATDLKDAYARACWARDDIRPLMLREQQARETEAARAKAAAARAAGGSITGAPTPGQIGQPQNPNATIEDDVREALRLVASRT
jgi:hypothetical protein